MNLEFFIAKRLITAKNDKSNASKRIIKIAVTAITISILMMIVSVGTGLGLQKKIKEKIASFNGHVMINRFDENESLVSLHPISTEQSFYPKFQTVLGISHIQAVAVKAGIIRTEKTFEGILFKGVGKDYQWSQLEEYLTQGRLPKINESLTNEVMLSKYLAQRLELELGDTFSTYFMKENTNQMPNLRVFKLVGIYDSGFQEFDQSYLIGDIRHVQKMNKWQPTQVGHFEIFIEDFSAIETKGKEIYKQTPSDLNTQTIQEKYLSIFEWLKLFDFNIIVILGIMTAVATINMVVALLVLILEKTQMIGILKALGYSNLGIRKIFLYQAVYLISKGLFWGNLLGLLLLFVQGYFGIIQLDPASYYVNTAPVYITWWHIAVLNLGTTLICLLVLLVPSYLISRILPASAIRYS